MIKNVSTVINKVSEKKKSKKMVKKMEDLRDS